MAVILAFRIAIVLAPTTYRLVKIEQSASGQPGPTSIPKYLWDRLRDPGESDADLSTALSGAIGRLSDVATFSGSFELRKLQVRWGRVGGAVAGTDDAVTTHHFIKLAGGVPSATWVTADFTTIEAAFLTAWNAIKNQFTETTSYKQGRWYKAGPGIAPPQPPVRVIDPAVIGTDTTNKDLPPQVAISVTEKTSSRNTWGRFYLPAPSSIALKSSQGRIDAGTQGAIADAYDAFYEACKAAGTPCVVYSAAKAVRQTAAEKRAGTLPGSLPAIDARAITVDELQVDDLFDVIRSRRYNEPLLRLQRAIA